jgi:hypothetical protein
MAVTIEKWPVSFEAGGAKDSVVINDDNPTFGGRLRLTRDEALQLRDDLTRYLAASLQGA